MGKEIKHISWSSLWCFDNNKQEFINRYVYDIKTPDNKYFKFGREYEEIMATTKYKDFDKQIEIREDVEWYEILWYVDFGNDDVWVECKTKSWRWSENDIRKSWQFRIYNHFKGDRKFYLHQYNKKQSKVKIQEISFEDKEFIPELYCKIKEMEEFLQPYWITICRNLKK